MKVNIGDEVVCIKKYDYEFITTGKIYEVLNTIKYDDGGLYICLLCDDGITRGYHYLATVFIPLSEWREQQINKVL